MGMFPVQNYGADFVNAMVATSGMMNDRRRLDMEEKRQADEQQTRDLQRESLRLDNQRKSTDLGHEQNLDNYLKLSQRFDAGNLSPEDYGTLTGTTLKLMKDVPYVPSDPKQIPQYKQSWNKILSGVQDISTLPPGNYMYTRSDGIPEVDSALDGFKTLLSKDRLGKEFVDESGTITGKPGTAYRTSDVGGFVMASGDGNKSAFTPMFSIVGKDGNPIIDASGKPVMVPATVGATNDPNAKLSTVTPEEMMIKAGFAYNLMDKAEKLGLADPVKGGQIIANLMRGELGTKGAEDVIKRSQDRSDAKQAGAALRASLDNNQMSDLTRQQGTLAADLLESGQVKDSNTAFALAKTMKPDKPVVMVPEGGILAGQDASGQYGVLVNNPKPHEKAPANVFAEAVKGADLARQFPEAKWLNPNSFYRTSQMNGQLYFAEDRPPKAPADPSAGIAKMMQGQTLKDALGRRAAALAKYNAVNNATGSEYVTTDGTKHTIAAGDLARVKEELDAANEEVTSLGGSRIKYASPSAVTLNSNAKVVRQRYEQLLQDPNNGSAAEDYLKSAIDKGYSADAIRYIKGELDNKIVNFTTPPAASAPSQARTVTAPPARPSAAPPTPQPRGMAGPSTGRQASQPTKTPAKGYVYQNGKLAMRR